MLVESRIDRIILLLFKMISRGIFVILFPERREVDIFRLNRYVNAPYEWPVLNQWGNADQFFLPRQTIKVEAQ